MMQMQAVTSNEIRATIDADLIRQFVAFVDRSEKTTRTYLTNLRQFVAWMHYAGIIEPTRADIIAYRDYLMHEHVAIVYAPAEALGYRCRLDPAGDPIQLTCKPNTVALYLRSVCQFFNWLSIYAGYPNIASNIHAPKISHNRHHKEALQAMDVLQIEQSIKDNAINRVQAGYSSEKDAKGRAIRATEQGKRLQAMYLLAVTAGLRTIELSRANIKDFECIAGQYWLYVWGKGHTEPDAKKAIASEVAEVITDYLQSRSDKVTGNAPLFVATGNRSKGKRLAPTTISTMLKRAMIDAGYNSERLTAHSLRHTAGTAVQDITGDIYATQKYMRHSNPATTEIYLHNDTEQQDAVIASDLYAYYKRAAIF